jgi:5-methylcytosine-specific restriction enzyme subunit McrC
MQNIIYEYEEVNNIDLKSHIINTSELHKYFKLEWKTFE